MNPPDINPAEFAAFVLILIRVSILVFLAPIFGSALVPNQIKAAMAMALAFVLLGAVKVDPNLLPTDLWGFLPLILGELFVGLALTLIVRMVLEGVQMAGQYIGFQMGFAVANVIDPQSGTQASVLSQFVYVLAMVIFLAFNGHHIVIRALVESFALVPPGRPDLSPLVMGEVSRGMSRLFVLAVKIGAPAMAVMFCTQVTMGIVAKTVPQMNVLFVGMPLYIVIGLFVFGLSLNYLVTILGRAVGDVNGSVFGIMRIM